MADGVAYLGMRRNRYYIYSLRKPVRALNEQIGEYDLYLDPGDCGSESICPALVKECYPDAFAALSRPLEFVAVTPLSGGPMIGEVNKYKE